MLTKDGSHLETFDMWVVPGAVRRQALGHKWRKINPHYCDNNIETVEHDSFEPMRIPVSIKISVYVARTTRFL